jgi:cysteine synthase
MIREKIQEIVAKPELTEIPLLKLGRFSTNNTTIWLKKEWNDPDGSDPIRSIKRKPASLLFSDILDKHYMDNPRFLISATSGNFGIELGLLSQKMNYTFFAVVPALTPEYNLEVMRKIGINIIKTNEQETCPREFTVFFVRGYAHEFHNRLVNVEQYYSWLNPLSHMLMTAKEISRGLWRTPDYIVASVGSCGTICGIRQYIIATGQDTKVIGVQPAID